MVGALAGNQIARECILASFHEFSSDEEYSKASKLTEAMQHKQNRYLLVGPDANVKRIAG